MVVRAIDLGKPSAPVWGSFVTDWLSFIVEVMYDESMYPNQNKKPGSSQGPTKKPETFPHGILEGEITALNEFGDGVLRVKQRVIKVARTVPGDMVRVDVPDNDKRYVYGKLLGILEQSSRRVPPECTAFSKGCGGCQWLGLEYRTQLYWKQKIVQEILDQRAPVDVKVMPVKASEKSEAYRNKMSLRNVNGRLAFMQDFNDLALIPETCRVATIPLQRFYGLIREFRIPSDIEQVHLRSTDQGTVGISLFAARLTDSVRDFALKLLETDPSLIHGIGCLDHGVWTLLHGEGFMVHRAAGIDFTFPLHGFFQTNYELADMLLDLALVQLRVQKHERVLDLYCGAGFFTLPLARKAQEVLGIESVQASIEGARANAGANRIENCSFSQGDAGQALDAYESGRFDAVLLDPPRTGCDQRTLDNLIRLAPERMVYISCSVESLARDLKTLCAKDYRVTYCQPVDMFPYTAHIENVLTLVRNRSWT